MRLNPITYAIALMWPRPLPAPLPMAAVLRHLAYVRGLRAMGDATR